VDVLYFPIRLGQDIVMATPLFGWSATDVLVLIQYCVNVAGAFSGGPYGAAADVQNLHDQVETFKGTLTRLKQYLETENIGYYEPGFGDDHTLSRTAEPLHSSIGRTLEACEQYFRGHTSLLQPGRINVRRRLSEAFMNVHGERQKADELRERLSVHETQIQTFIIVTAGSVHLISFGSTKANFDQMAT
jgi:hypothetical protein